MKIIGNIKYVAVVIRIEAGAWQHAGAGSHAARLEPIVVTEEIGNGACAAATIERSSKINYLKTFRLPPGCPAGWLLKNCKQLLSGIAFRNHFIRKLHR
jgi:hypothetical protein